MTKPSKWYLEWVVEQAADDLVAAFASLLTAHQQGFRSAITVRRTTANALDLPGYGPDLVADDNVRARSYLTEPVVELELQHAVAASGTTPWALAKDLVAGLSGEHAPPLHDAERRLIEQSPRCTVSGDTCNPATVDGATLLLAPKGAPELDDARGLNPRPTVAERIDPGRRWERWSQPQRIELWIKDDWSIHIGTPTRSDKVFRLPLTFTAAVAVRVIDTVEAWTGRYDVVTGQCCP